MPWHDLGGRLADYGLALRDFVNVGMTATEVASLAGRIRNEVVKDDRIDTATVTVTPTPDGSEIDILILITAVDLAIGEFSMTINKRKLENARLLRS